MQFDYLMSRSFICSQKSSIGEAKTLWFTTDSLTRNVELLQTINSVEHGVSYWKLPAINTAVGIQKLAETESCIALSTET